MSDRRPPDDGTGAGAGAGAGDDPPMPGDLLLSPLVERIGGGGDNVDWEVDASEEREVIPLKMSP